MSRRVFFSFLAGGLTAGSLGGLVLVLLGASGIRSAPSIKLSVAVVAVVAATAWLARWKLDSAWFRAGALAAVVLAVAAEIVTSNPGIGVTQWLVAGAGVAVAVLGPRLLSSLVRPWPRWLIGLGLVLLIVGLVRVVIGGGGFGHDESAYALKGRAWVQGTPETGWEIHRGWIQSVIAAAILPFTSSQLVMRLVSAGLTVGTVAAVWWLGRTVRSNRVGLVGAAVFATGPSVLRRGAEFLTDLPSTGLLLVVTALLWSWLTERVPRDSTLMWAVVVATVAFYWRYQAILSLGLLVVGAAVVFGRRLKENRRSVVRAAIVGMVLLAPHVVYAIAETGRPWGILTWTGDVAGRAYLGEGLVDYASALPDQLAGQIGALALVAALVWLGWRLVRAAARGGMEATDRVAVFLAIPALGHIGALGLISHGEPRFVFYPVALLLVMAALAADDLRRRVPAEWFRVGAVGLTVAVVALFGLNATRTDRNAEARAASIAILEEAAATVLARSDGPCGIVTTYAPQLTWFSGCPTDLPGLSAAEVDLDPALDGFLVLFDRGKRQPTGAVLDAYLALAEGDPTVIDDPVDSIGDARIWALAD